MKLTVKLLIAQFRRHWIKTLLALGAIAVATAMVVIFVGGQDVAMAQGQVVAAQPLRPLGKFDMIIYSASSKDMQMPSMRIDAAPRAPMNEKTLEWLKSNSDVKSIVEFCQATAKTARIDQPAAGAHPRMSPPVTLLATACPSTPFEIERGDWLNKLADGQVVVDYAIAARLVPSPTSQPADDKPTPPPGMGGPDVKIPEPPPNTIGSEFRLITGSGRAEVKIGGVVKLPTKNMRSLVAIYVTPTTFEKLTGYPAKPNRIMLQLKEGASEEKFIQDFANAAKKFDQPIHLVTNADMQAAAGRDASRAPSMGPGFFPVLRNAEVNLALLAAMFVVFSTLSMGLQERTRQLAMLRAIGMTRRRMVWLIAFESIVLATVGYLIGLAVGIVKMYSIVASIEQTYGQRLTLNLGLWAGLGALAAYGATFASAILPSFFAARRKPLEGMTGSPMLWAPKFPIWMIPVGLILIAINPAIALTGSDEIGPGAVTWRTTAVPISCLGAIIGFALLMPLAVLGCERLFGAAAAAIFGLNKRLLGRQLSANLWRTIGCATALMVGLGLYVTVQIWGQSMLRPFVLPPRSPDVVITLMPDGIADSKLGEVTTISGIRKIVPLIMEHPDVADLPEYVMKPDEVMKFKFSRSVIMLGGDIKALLGSGDGIMSVNYLRGNESDAMAMLASGNACLMTDGLYNRAPEKYDVGMTVEMDTPGGANAKVKYTIAGVIEVSGWQWMTKFAPMRKLGAVGGMMFVPLETARAAYPNAKFRNFWLTLNDGVDSMTLEAPMNKIANGGLAMSQPTSRPATASRDAAVPPGDIVTFAGAAGDAKGNGLDVPPGVGGMDGMSSSGRGGPGGGYGGRRGVIGQVGGTYANVTDMRQVTTTLMGRSGSVLDNMTQYTILALRLATLAVIGAMIASVRARNWEIGVLRSIGMTRWQLARLILAEGLLIGFLATVVSLVFGILISWTGIVSSRQQWAVNATFVIPWWLLLRGIGETVLLCLAGSVLPALVAAWRRPVSLLRKGRTID